MAAAQTLVRSQYYQCASTCLLKSSSANSSGLASNNINTKKLQFIHSVNGDTSKTAKIIAITLPECQRDAE